MNFWVLFVLILGPTQYYVKPQGMYKTEIQCLEAQMLFTLSAPKPKINYDSICIKTDKVTMQ